MTKVQLDESLVSSHIDDNLEIRDLIGQGSMGVTYRAYQKDFERDVCVKFLKNLTDSQASARFTRESKMLCKLDHANIVKFYYFGVHQNIYPFFVMEFVRGISLREKLKTSGALPIPECIDAMKQVCAALQYAHQNGLVHRDIKPDNIMLESGDTTRVKILDFGVAGFGTKETRGNAARITSDGEVLGSLPYLAPEVFRGAGTSAESDIYALGCMIYELLTGRAPFVSNDLQSLVAMHLRQEIPALPDSVGNARQRKLLSALLQKATAKDPAARFTNCNEMARALDSVLSTNFNEQPSSRTVKLNSAHWMKIALPTVISLIVLCGLGMTYFNKGSWNPSTTELMSLLAAAQDNKAKTNQVLDKVIPVFAEIREGAINADCLKLFFNTLATSQYQYVGNPDLFRVAQQSQRISPSKEDQEDILMNAIRLELRAGHVAHAKLLLRQMLPLYSEGPRLSLSSTKLSSMSTLAEECRTADLKEEAIGLMQNMESAALRLNKPELILPAKTAMARLLVNMHKVPETLHVLNALESSAQWKDEVHKKESSAIREASKSYITAAMLDTWSGKYARARSSLQRAKHYARFWLKDGSAEDFFVLDQFDDNASNTLDPDIFRWSKERRAAISKNRYQEILHQVSMSSDLSKALRRVSGITNARYKCFGDPKQHFAIELPTFLNQKATLKFDKGMLKKINGSSDWLAIRLVVSPDGIVVNRQTGITSEETLEIAFNGACRVIRTELVQGRVHKSSVLHTVREGDIVKSWVSDGKRISCEWSKRFTKRADNLKCAQVRHLQIEIANNDMRKAKIIADGKTYFFEYDKQRKAGDSRTKGQVNYQLTDGLIVTTCDSKIKQVTLTKADISDYVELSDDTESITARWSCPY